MRIVPKWLETWRAGTLAVAERNVGRLVVPSGAIVACDPLTAVGRTLPFTRAVTPGTYDVKLGSGGDIVFALLRFEDTPVVTWEIARCSNDETIQRPGFGVDTGQACFVDARVASAYRAMREAQADVITANMVASPEDAAAWHAEYASARDALPDPLRALLSPSKTSAHVVELDGGNLIAFTSGAGDGAYPTFWGLDAEGAPVVLMIDFGLLDDRDDATDEDEPDRDDDAKIADLRVRADAIVQRWERGELIELTKRADRDVFVTALAQELAELDDEDDIGAVLSSFLIGRREVAEVFATDEQLAASMTP